MRTYANNGLNIAIGSLTDALTIDLPVALAATYLMPSDDGLPPLDNAIYTAMPGVMIAACTYTFRDIARGKLLSLDIEKEEAVPTLWGGIIGGALKYTTKYMISNAYTELLSSTTLAHAFIGAINNGLYEDTRSFAFGIITADTAIVKWPMLTLMKIATLSILYGSFEGLDNVLMEGISDSNFLVGAGIGTLTAASLLLISESVIGKTLKDGILSNPYITASILSPVICSSIESIVSFAANLPIESMIKIAEGNLYSDDFGFRAVAI